MKKFEDWYMENRPMLALLSNLFFLPKKWKAMLNTVISTLDLLYSFQVENLAASFEDGREVLPCIRVNSDGSTTLINCKTGAEIKPQTPQ